MYAILESPEIPGTSFESMRPPKLTPGFIRPLTVAALVPRRSDGLRPTRNYEWTSTRCGGRSKQTRQREICHASSWELQDRSVRVLSILYRKLRDCAGNTGPGSTLMVPTAGLRRAFPKRRWIYLD